MIIIASINVDLLTPLPVQTVNAKQGDTARGIEFNLFDGGEPFNIPAGTYGAFRAAKPDGTYCFYDSANGQSAVSIYGNTVTVLLADQVLTADGTVNCEVNLYNAAGEKVTSFNVDIAVQESVLPDPLISESYVSFLTDLAQQIISAGIGIAPLGFYTTLADLEAGVPNPNPGDMYGVGASEPFDFYCYDIVSGAWVDMGTMAGPQGPQGPKGDTGYGIPTGGSAGQVIMKLSSTDYDIGWSTPSGQGDMLKSVYDTNNNGIVDNSERLGNQLPSYYQQKITTSGMLKGTGTAVIAATAGTDYQAPITANGILKGAGGGSVAAAVAGTDYQTPLTAGTDYVAPPSNVSGSGAVTVTLANNREYTYTGVTSLAITGAAVNAHGFITFAASTPTITSPAGFSGVSGDEITTAAASETWEFSCAGGYIVFKNWGAS